MVKIPQQSIYFLLLIKIFLISLHSNSHLFLAQMSKSNESDDITEEERAIVAENDLESKVECWNRVCELSYEMEVLTNLVVKMKEHMDEVYAYILRNNYTGGKRLMWSIETVVEILKRLDNMLIQELL